MHVCVKHITVSRVFDHMLRVCPRPQRVGSSVNMTVHAEFYLLTEQQVIASDETTQD